MDTLSLSSQVKSGHLPLDYNPFLPLQSNGEKVDKITTQQQQHSSVL